MLIQSFHLWNFIYIYLCIYLILQLPENLENEIEILEDLLSIFNDMMDSLGDADLEDR